MVKNRIKLVICVISFGTIGTVSHFVPLSSFALVFYRALIGAAFIFLYTVLTKKEFRINVIKDNIFLLTIASIAMGLNWVFMFLAFQYASVSIGTVCINLMPLMLMIIAYFLFGEKITKKTIFCFVLATIGLVLVSNVLYTGFKSKEMLGVFFGILCAVFTAITVMANKKLEEVNPYEKVVYEFLLAAILMIPLILIDKNSSFAFGKTDNLVLAIIMFLILCLYITGVVYVVYYDCVVKSPSRELAITTYLDPITAFFLSNIVLHEKMNSLQLCGAILMLLATVFNELVHFRKNTKSGIKIG